ncbi:tetratricopeptide repeat protein, partial [Vicingaceae bacterium]|nr:tetratricopeptide repeat protein [Vicingaceae bacterium]
MTTVVSSDSDRDPVELLAEEFLARYRSGETPTPSEYAEQYPEFSKQIRELFPTLLMMENFSPQKAGSTDPGLTREEDQGPMPEHLGEYRILRMIGRGGMGVVYEAVHQSLGRHVALKVLPSSRLDGNVSRERFRREAVAAAQLHHTNIVPVFDVGEFEGAPYYAMQFIKGRSLDAVVSQRRAWRSSQGGDRRRTLPVDADPTELKNGSSDLDGQQIAEPASAGSTNGNRRTNRTESSAASVLSFESGSQYFKSVTKAGIQVADALEYVHSHDILHRDIKPSNLILDEEDRIWITDFGLAKTTGSDDLTQTGGIVGTLRYMAPERFSGLATPASDIFSLGATLYELLTAHPAFAADDRLRLIEQIQHDDPPRPRKIDPRIPVDLETIVLKAMEKDPNRRYPAAKDLANDLSRWLRLEPISARPISAVGRVVRWAQRRPLVASLLTTIVILTITGFSVITWKWQEADHQRMIAEKNSERAQSIVYEFYSEVAKKWGPLHRTPGTQELRQRLLDKAKVYFSTFLNESPTASTEYQLAHARYCFADILAETGDFESAKENYQSSIDTLEILTKKEPNNAQYRKILAFSYSGLGRLVVSTAGPARGIDLHREALQILEQLSRDEPGDKFLANSVAASQVNLGSALNQTGQFADANDLYEKAIAIREQLRTYGSDFSFELGLAIGYRKQGDLYWQQADTDVAIESYEKAMSIFEQLQAAFPDNDWDQADFGATCVVLGSAYRQLGRLDKALDVYQTGIEILEEHCKNNPRVFSNHALLAKLCNNTANANDRKGNCELAERQYQRAAEIQEELMSTHPEIPEYRDGQARTVRNLAMLYHRADKSNQAFKLIQKCVSIREKLCKDYPTVSDHADRLADAYRALGRAWLWQYGRDADPQKSRALFEKSLEICKRLCDEYPSDSNYKNGMAESYSGLGRSFRMAAEFMANEDRQPILQLASSNLEKSAELQKEVVQSQSKIAGAKVTLASMQLARAIVENQLGHTDTAIKDILNSIDLLETICGESPESTFERADLLATWLTLGSVQSANQNNEEAAKAYSQAIAHGKALIAVHPDVIQFHSLYARSLDSLVALGAYDNDTLNAIEQYRRIAAVVDKIDPSKISVEQRRIFGLQQNKLGSLFLKTGDRSKAIEYYRKAIKLRKTIVGNNPDVRVFQNELAQTYNNLGRVYLTERQNALAKYQLSEAIDIRIDWDLKTMGSWGLTGLAISFENRGNAHDRSGKTPAAEEDFRKAIVFRTEYVNRWPNHAQGKYKLASDQVRLANMLQIQKKIDQAEQQYNKAYEIQTQLSESHPENVVYRVTCLG